MQTFSRVSFEFIRFFEATEDDASFIKSARLQSDSSNSLLLSPVTQGF